VICSVFNGRNYGVYECDHALVRPSTSMGAVSPFDAMAVLPPRSTYLGQSETPVGQIVASSSSMGTKDIYLMNVAAVIARYIYERMF
jgi:hypothetical protein